MYYGKYLTYNFMYDAEGAKHFIYCRDGSVETGHIRSSLCAKRMDSGM